MENLRTWIEIDKKALRHNVEQFLRLIPRRTRFMAVVKSNAYGHGLVQIAKLFSESGIPAPEQVRYGAGKNQESGVHDSKLWFGVDSIVEALRLRQAGIKNPILVLGSTLPPRMSEAAESNIILTISNFESLLSLIRTNKRIDFHIKIDTGMHRQGFLPFETLKLIKLLKRSKLTPSGVYTHFASAKDVVYPTYTSEQLRKFNEVVSKFKTAGFKNLIRHAAASGGALLFPESHLDMVRVGMGMYGYWPSPEAKIAKNVILREQGDRRISRGSFTALRMMGSVVLNPVLTWKTLVSEIKEVPAGSYVGYDLTERVNRKTKIAVLPVGYWHGYDRGFSSVGEALIRGKRRKVLGRVSMDMTVVDVTDSPKVGVGDEAVLIGRHGKEAIWADELSLKISTTPYEFLTRINPLIKRIGI